MFRLTSNAGAGTSGGKAEGCETPTPARGGAQPCPPQSPAALYRAGAEPLGLVPFPQTPCGAG